jgi:hypothetical protein
MDEEENRTPPPTIFIKPTWQERPLYILDIIDNNDFEEIQQCNYEFWGRVYRNIEILERAIIKCIENRNMRMLELIVNMLPRPDDEVCGRIFVVFRTNKWMEGYKFLLNAW